MINPEGGLEDTTVPRLLRAGAKLVNILSISTIKVTDPITGMAYERPFTLPHDLSLLEKAILRLILENGALLRPATVKRLALDS